jgi:hypothetical protein
MEMTMNKEAAYEDLRNAAERAQEGLQLDVPPWWTYPTERVGEAYRNADMAISALLNIIKEEG